MITRAKTLLAVLFGLVGWYAVAIAADFLLVTQWEVAGGMRFAVHGAIQFILGGTVVLVALRLAGTRPVVVGFTRANWRSDILIGLAVVIVFAALQFFLVIPATGGAARSDVVANAGQLGDQPATLAGVLVLALLGSASEELLFRGLLLGGLALAFGGGRWARIAATAIVVILFALGHGYQGWAGMIDTGLYGGLALSLLYWWREGRLAAPVAAHIGWNAIASVAIFFAY